jgi:tetratricopeptide (TPR) repeat protein
MRARSQGRGFWLAAAAVLAACGADSAASEPECPGASEPGGLAGMDPPVREEYQKRRQALESLLARPDAPAPETGGAAGRLGEWFQAFGYFAEAVACYAEAERLAPEEGRWPYLFGQVASRTGDFDTAREQFRRVLALRPQELPALIGLAGVELKLDRLEEAKALGLQALAVDPRSAPALSVLGRAELAKGDHEAAIRHLEEALTLQPGASSLHYPLGLAYRGHGDLELAREHMQRAGVGEQRKAVPFLDEPAMRDVARLRALGAQALQSRGLVALRQRRFDEAIANFREAVEANPEEPTAQVELGTALLEAGRIAEGMEQLEAVVERWVNQAKAHHLLGLAFEKQRRLTEAAQHYEAALASNPGLKAAQERLGAVLLQQGRPEEALARFEAFAALDPGSAQARFLVAQTLLGLGRHAEARAALEQARGLAPERDDLRLVLARLLAAAPEPAVRDGARALELAREAFARRPTLFGGQTLAMAHAELGQFDQALHLQGQALAVAHRSGVPQYVELARRRLALYQARQPCREPFVAGERPEREEP